MSTINNISPRSFLNYAILLVFLTSLCWSCDSDQNQQVTTVDDHTLIYNELITIEHAILTSDLEKAKMHSDNLDKVLKSGYNLFCPDESAQIDGARMSNYLLGKNIEDRKSSKLLDDLRILKATIINLETDEDYDPYFAFLWKYEEEMYITTGVAIDPMLDLYEWNEFEDMVACMNQAWQPVQMHYPSPEHLNYDPIKYKNQTTFKIYLENSMNHFNEAVQNVNHEDYPLCESAEAVRNAYIEYLNTFIKLPNNSNFILAKI